MKKLNCNEIPNLPLKAAAIAIALAFSVPSWADEDDEVARLIKPESSFRLGAGYVSNDNQRFGMYNGLSEQGMVGLIDFSVVRRDDDTGTWYRAIGRNLGLDNRELRLEHERQGKWGYFLEFNQITRNTPYDVQTNVRGIGSEALVVPTGLAGNPKGASTLYNLKTERQKTSFGLNYALPSNFQVRVLFQNEEKEGQRLFGRGTTGGAAPIPQEFLAEPINSTTRQVDVLLDYTGESLQMSGGYYGSFFSNQNPVLRVTGGDSRFNSGVGSTGVAMDNISLPPDNHGHQFNLTGGYQLAKTTRLNFTLNKGITIQNEDFMPVRFYGTSNNGVNANTSGRTDLGGRVDTTLVNLGLTSRPIPQLSLLGNIRYEERDDKTSVARYISNVTGSGLNPTITPYSATVAGDKALSTNGFNEPRSLTNRSGKLEASYLLPEGFRLTGGFDYEQKVREMEGVRVVGYRQETEEKSYRLEVSRAMAETLTGSLAYTHSKRDGSDYRNLVTLGNYSYPNYTPGGIPCGRVTSGFSVTRCGLIQPIYLADRERDKIRWIMDWSPLEQLSAQFTIEGSRDNYGPGRGSPDIGVRDGDSRLYAIDLSYAVTEKWKLTSWLSHTEAGIGQSTIASPGANATAVLWSSEQKNVVDSFGVGVRGKLPYAIDIGADYLFANDRTRYDMGNTGYFSKTASVSSLPDISYRQKTLRLFGTHAFDKKTSFRLDYIFDKRNIDDWTWSGWTYSDGTRIVQKPNEIVHFIGFSVSYAFR